MASQQLDISQLSLDQLTQLRSSISEEIQLITGNYGNLKVAHGRFQQSLEALQEMVPANQGKKIMVPLTSSMYVPGELASCGSVLVDVGTGYFIEKPTPDATKYIQGKLELLQSNMDKVGVAIVNKRRDLEAVTMLIQAKSARLQQEQSAQLAKLEGLKA